MFSLFLVLFVGLQIKHYVADYLLQTGWMLAGKGDLRHPGGYAHAGVHAVLSALVLLGAAVPLVLMAALVLAEWALHYGLDYAKAAYSRGVHPLESPQRFWALHGIDQLAHQLTYAGMVYVVAGSTIGAG